MVVGLVEVLCSTEYMHTCIQPVGRSLRKTPCLVNAIEREEAIYSASTVGVVGGWSRGAQRRWSLVV